MNVACGGDIVLCVLQRGTRTHETFFLALTYTAHFLTAGGRRELLPISAHCDHGLNAWATHYSVIGDWYDERF